MGLRCGARCALRTVIGTLVLVASALAAAAGPPQPTVNWSGVYFGPHVGYAWASPSYTFDTFAGPEHFNHNASDWFIGGHIGIQHQWNRLVAGVELAYSDIKLSDTVEATLIPGRFRTIEIDELFTATARLGYAFDHWLAYVRGGYASANIDTRVFANGSAGSTTSGREGGWLIGGGLEFMCSPRWVFGLEYNYVKLDIDDRSGLLPDLKPFYYKDADTDIHTVKARVSFLLGPAPAPPPPLK